MPEPRGLIYDSTVAEEEPFDELAKPDAKETYDGAFADKVLVLEDLTGIAKFDGAIVSKPDLL